MAEAEAKEAFATGTDNQVKLKIKPKTCDVCGEKFIPSCNRQKTCHECRKKMNKNPSSKLRKDTEAVFGPGSYKEPAADPEEHHAATVREKKEPARAEDPGPASARCIDLELRANGKSVARLMIDKDTAAGAVRLAEIIRTVKEILC